MQIVTFGIIFGIILGVAALSGMFSERSGTVNIAINGMMIGGAMIYWILSRTLDLDSAGMQFAGYLIAMLCGLVFGIIFGFAALTLKANQIIVGTAINLIFAAIGLFMYKKMGAESAAIVLSSSAGLSPNQLDIKYIVSLISGLGLIVFLFSWIWIKFTPWGLRLKAAGENPHALDSQGISVMKTRYYGILISGALASLAGAMYAQASGKFSGNVAGFGFIALAIMIAGQWNTGLIVVASLIFGLLYSTGTSISVYFPKLSKVDALIQAIPFILSVLVLILTSKKSRAPKSVGIPYDKSTSS